MGDGDPTWIIQGIAWNVRDLRNEPVEIPVIWR